MIKFLISADIYENKIYLNNLFRISFSGKILIKYFNVLISTHDLFLNSESSIIWLSPLQKMTNISKIKVIIIDENENEIIVSPIIHQVFMRYNDSGLNSLCEFIKKCGKEINNIIEIGSFQGESTLIFHKQFQNSTIFAVDIWKNNYDDSDWVSNSANMIDSENNFKTLTKNIDNIIKIKMTSSNFSNIIADKSIDFIYIDGDHSYNGINNDIIKWKNKIKNGGFIGGHDYTYLYNDSVIKSVKENFSENEINTFTISQPFSETDKKFLDTSWLVKL